MSGSLSPRYLYSQGCTGEIGGYQAVFGLEPRVAQATGPDTALHQLLDPVIVVVMSRLGDFK